MPDAGNFSVLKNSKFSFLTCYRDVSRYIKTVWIVDNAINAPKGLFGMNFYGFAIVKVG